MKTFSNMAKRGLSLIMAAMMLMGLCVFSASASTEEVETLLDVTFDDKTFATSGANDWFTLYRSDISGANLETLGITATTANYDAALGYYHIAEYSAQQYYAFPVYKHGTTDKALQISQSWNDNTQNGTLAAAIPFSKPVSDGTLTVEFDILPSAAANYARMGVGLRDTTKHSDTTEFNPWTSWTKATLFGGYTTWGSGYLNIVAGQRNVGGALPDLYMLADDPTAADFDKNTINNYIPDATMKAREDFIAGSSSGTNWHGTALTDSGVASTYEYKGTPTTLADPSSVTLKWETWKFVIDMENNTYEFHRNGNLAKSLDYIPGGEAGTYDAFVAVVGSFRNNSSNQLVNETHEMSIAVDNVKVTHKAPAATEPTDPGASTDRSLLSENFDERDFATSGRNDWFTLSRSDITSANLSSLGITSNAANYNAALGYYHINEDYYDPSYYAFPVYKHGSTTDKALQVSQTWNETVQNGSLAATIPFSKPVSDGRLTVEFNVLPSAVGGYTRMGVGLRDTEHPNTEFNPWTNWANATLFGGYTAWGFWTVNLVAGQRNVRGVLPDVGLLGNDPNASTFDKNPHKWISDAEMKAREDFIDGPSKTGSSSGYSALQDSGVSDSYQYTGTPTTLADPSTVAFKWESWKFVIDMDNNCYDFYRNGELAKSLDYIPGGEAGTYDAFVAVVGSFAGPSANTTSNTTQEMSIAIDNISVTHEEVKPAVEGAYMETCFDQEITLTDGLTNVSTGTMSARFDFNIPVDETSAKSEISISPAIEGYEVQVLGNQLLMDFPKGLAAGTTYTVDFGNVESLSGYTPEEPISYTFTTDAGSSAIVGPTLEIDGAPMASLKDITENSVVSADLVFLNTASGTPRGGVLYLAAYQDNVLLGAKKAVAPAVAGVTRVQLSANATTDGFLGADKIRAFLFNNETDVKPMMESVDFPNANEAVANFTSYDSTNNAGSRSAVSQASLGDASVPTLTTVGGKTGWTLDADGGKKAYIAVDLSPEFTGGGLDTDDAVQVEIEYYNNSYAGFAFIYQGADGDVQGQYQQMTQSNTWQTATFILEDASFAKDASVYTRKGEATGEAHDFYITASDYELSTVRKRFMGTSTQDIIIRSVTVNKLTDRIAPFDITVDSEETIGGNVFVYGNFGTSMDFTISYTDPKGTYTSGTAVYTAKDYSGKTVWTKTQSFTGGADSLSIPWDASTGIAKYGLYTLEIEVTGEGGISQKKIVDFSITLEGVTNMRYGNNVHLDWCEAYTREDIKDIVDLIKASGIGVIRTKIVWNDFDKDADGVPEIPTPDDSLWAQEYIKSQGLKTLCIIANTNYAARTEADKAADGNYYDTLKDPTMQDNFATFCAWVVETYGAYTDYFSIGNEYNHALAKANFQPHPDTEELTLHVPDSYVTYLEIMKKVYPAMRAKNGNVKVVAGELAGWYEEEWITNALNAGMNDYCDIVSYHKYEYSAVPEWNQSSTINWKKSPWVAAQEAYKLITSYTNSTTGSKIRPWITETGFCARENVMATDVTDGAPRTIDEVTAWYPRYYAIQGYEIDKVMLYAFTDNNTDYFSSQNFYGGMSRAHDWRTPFAAKPGLIAMSAFTYFTGNDEQGANAQTNVNGSVYSQHYTKTTHYPDGVKMAWTSSGTGTFTASISGATKVNVWDMYGNFLQTVDNSTSITVSTNPRYITKAR